MFTLNGVEGDKAVEVIGGERTLAARNGSFSDRFGPWDVHLYRVPPEPKR